MDDIRSRVSYSIRRHDIELAETFVRCCPVVSTVPELNRFFHTILTQYPKPLLKERLCLDDELPFDHWLRHFESAILPTLVTLRFPPVLLTPLYAGAAVPA